jgi:hypothetical protein
LPRLKRMPNKPNCSTKQCAITSVSSTITVFCVKAKHRTHSGPGRPALKAAKLAERLQKYDYAISVYRRLQEMFPPLRLEDKIKLLQTRG